MSWRQKTGNHRFRSMQRITSIAAILLLAGGGYLTYKWFSSGGTMSLPVVGSSVSSQPDVDETPVSPKQVDEHSVPPTHPRYITISKIGITKTRIFPVGLAKDGTVDVPKNIYDTAWYTGSSTPGSGNGAVLIDAHNGGYSKDGIFANLSKLVIGDIVTIERGDGKLITYKVVSSVVMSLDEANSHGVKDMMASAEAGKEGLSLITCAGNYQAQTKQFDKRVMVRAVRA